MADNEAGDVVAPLAKPHTLATLVEDWFAENFHGSPHMRDTGAFNHVRAAVDDLKRRLTEEHGQ
jgi:hypothetical protein